MNERDLTEPERCEECGIDLHGTEDGLCRHCLKEHREQERLDIKRGK